MVTFQLSQTRENGWGSKINNVEKLPTNGKRPPKPSGQHNEGISREDVIPYDLGGPKQKQD